MYDILIKNGIIVDGFSRQKFRADIAVADGKVVKISQNINETATKTINAGGQIVVPAFIDSHTHSDILYFKDNENTTKVSQGIGTEIVGLCGFSPIHYQSEYNEEIANYNTSVIGHNSLSFNDFTDYKTQLNKSNPSVNVASFIAHGSLRASVMGYENRPATEQEIGKMERFVETAMQQGAVGISFGMIYAPGKYTPKEEMIRASKIVAKYNGIASFHMRDESKYILDSIDEVVGISKASGVKAHISHLKVSGSDNVYLADKALEKIEKLKTKENICISFDVYPYAASSTTLLAPLPSFIDIDNLAIEFADKSKREKTIEFFKIRNTQEDFDKIMISTAPKEFEKYVGRTLSQIGSETSLTSFETCLFLLSQSKEFGAIFFLQSQENVDKIVCHEDSIVISDGMIPNPQNTNGVHPRVFGSFAVLLENYVKSEKLSLEEAIKKITYMPAKLYSLKGRGSIKVGNYADITIFNLEKVRSLATYSSPNILPEGFSHTIINGILEIENGIPTQTHAGKFVMANEEFLQKQYVNSDGNVFPKKTEYEIQR